MDLQFGTLLKDWRHRRRLSQIELGLSANVSARHIAFLEVGRSRPSRMMVVQLSEALDIPRLERNMLLNSAGFSPAYKARDLDQGEMSAIREAVDWMLLRHDPYPAFALDKHWVIHALNRSAEMLLGSVNLGVGQSMLDAMIGSETMRDAFENWPEVARYTVNRLRTENAHLGGDPVLERAIEKLSGETGLKNQDEIGVMPAVMTVRYRFGDRVLSFFSTIAQFGTAEDIALADLRIELTFPADEATRDLLLSAEAAQ